MFRWGKKAEGFEWRNYVRTTVKLRREQRREQVHAAKDAAVAQGKAAGGAVAAFGSSAAGLATAGTRSLLSAIWVTGIAMLRAAIGMLGGLVPRTGRMLAPLLAWIEGRRLSSLVALGGGLAIALAAMRAQRQGLDLTSLLAMAAGAVVMLAAAAAWLSGASTAARGIVARLPLSGPRLAALALLSIAGSGLGAAYRADILQAPGLALPRLVGVPFATSRVIEGRASALTGDTLRVADTVVRLAGLEAPDREQRCASQAANRWKCGEAAQDALQKLIRGRVIRCEASGTDDAGRALAVCRDGTIDINVALVKGGHVFATTGLLAPYRSLEAGAQAARAGIWRGGQAERPAEFRAKAWDAAKAKAPDGCPIKGRVTAAGKTYVVPWSADYAGIKLQPGKGERWFCSEADATAAGWRSALRP